MKNIIKEILREEINKRLSANDMYSYIQEIHPRIEDFEEGDIYNRVFKFDWYELKELPIEKIDTDEFYTDENVVEEYMDEYKNNPDYPPIVFDPEGLGSIIDGAHRAKALENLGLKTIKTYVGKKN